jgi:hypothetical protein
MSVQSVARGAPQHPACHFCGNALDFPAQLGIKHGFPFRTRAGSAGEVGRPVEQMALAEVPSWLTPNSPFTQVAVRRKNTRVSKSKA